MFELAGLVRLCVISYRGQLTIDIASHYQNSYYCSDAVTVLRMFLFGELDLVMRI